MPGLIQEFKSSEDSKCYGCPNLVTHSANHHECDVFGELDSSGGNPEQDLNCALEFALVKAISEEGVY